jgi:hypothetical protein
VGQGLRDGARFVAAASAGDVNFDDVADAFSIAHNLQGEGVANALQCRGEFFTLRAAKRLPLDAACSRGAEEDCVISRGVTVDRDAVEGCVGGRPE